MSVEEEIFTVKKIYPPATELNSVKTSLKCLFEGCDKIFATESNLTLHIVKCHQRRNLEKRENIIYHHHCPEIDCIYHNDRHFKKLKYLKQHYLKVHAEKIFICDTCKKGFPTLAHKNSHKEVCGITFTCLECPNMYSTYESLITHGRRKKHAIADRSLFIKKSGVELNKCASEITNKVPLILPKQSTSMQTIRIIPITLLMEPKSESSDKGIQTEPWHENKKTKNIKRRSTIHTQTSGNKRKVRRSAETQTIGDCILKKAIQDEKIIKNEIEMSQKTSETQTKANCWINGAGEHCSTQTGIKSDASCSSLESGASTTSINSCDKVNCFEEYNFENCQETQTDILLNDDFLQPSLFSHIETQTCDDIDLYTNMHTQTCDDQLLDFGFNDIQTQTTWPDYDLFVSTETQTLLTQNKNFFDIPLSVSHMETQTDMEFKQLLEEINA